MKCKNLCGKDLTGRQLLYCSDKCRMQHKRQAESEQDAPQPERIIPNRSNSDKVEVGQKPDKPPLVEKAGESFPKIQNTPEFGIPNFGEPDCQCTHCKNNRVYTQQLVINHGAWKPASELGKNEINRVTLPGDVDYVGVAV